MPGLAFLLQHMHVCLVGCLGDEAQCLCSCPGCDAGVALYNGFLKRVPLRTMLWCVWDQDESAVGCGSQACFALQSLGKPALAEKDVQYSGMKLFDLY